MKVRSDLWPFGKKAAFAIRDDDVSYFTQPWMLDLLYSEAWRLGFKVSLAVIPKIKATKSLNVPPSFRGSNKLFSISKNEELVDYLLDKIAGGHVDVVQHGYSHAHEGGKPEFAINDLNLLNEKLKKGNRLLRETFKQDVNVFTAPHERISRAAWKSISQNEMCLSRRFTLGRFLVTAPLSSINFNKLYQTVSRSPNPLKLMASSTIDITNTLVIQWDLLLSPSEALEGQIEDARKTLLERLDKGEPFVILHHYWEYFCGWESKTIMRDLFNHFNSFLNLVSSNDKVWKTTLSEICSRIRG